MDLEHPYALVSLALTGLVLGAMTLTLARGRSWASLVCAHVPLLVQCWGLMLIAAMVGDGADACLPNTLIGASLLAIITLSRLDRAD